MIVKTISHRSTKKSSIRKLIQYITNLDKTHDTRYGRKPLIVKKMLRGYDKDKWADAFYKNDKQATFTHKRRTVLRHEIISFAPESNKHITREKLKTICKWYLKNRSPKSLGLVAIHWDEAPHAHFLISAVAADGTSTRVSRSDFKQFKINLQYFQQSRFPELSASVVEHNSSKKRLELKLTQKEQHMKKSRGVISDKEKLSQQVMQFARGSVSLEELENRLKNAQLKPYHRRGMLAGVCLANKKYRLTTLGVGKEHLQEMTREQKRLNQLKTNSKSLNKDLER